MISLGVQIIEILNSYTGQNGSEKDPYEVERVIRPPDVP